MTRAKAEILKTLEAQVAARRENKLKSFVPYPKQIEFCNATADHGEAVLQAGNQLGKSEVGAFMAATFAPPRSPPAYTPTGGRAAGSLVRPEAGQLASPLSPCATCLSASYAGRLAMMHCSAPA